MSNTISILKMKEVFKKGEVISIVHANTNQIMLSILQEIEGRDMYFRASNEFITGDISLGDILECNVVVDDYEYVLEGKIFKIDKSYPNLLGVTIDEIRKYKNRRKHKRYLVNFHAKMSMFAEDDAATNSTIKNISYEGLCLLANKHLEVPTKVRVKAAINFDDIEVIEFTAAIIKRANYNEEYNEYGMEIEQIDDVNKELLYKLIYQLEEDESLLIAENLK